MGQNHDISAKFLNTNRIRQKTVVDQAMEQIRLLLTSGRYKPGDKIPTEQELAELFGIGRSSIREALKIFQHLGVLEFLVPKGTFLSSNTNISTEAITWSIFLGTKDIGEIVKLRQVIEEAALCSALDRYAKDHQKFEFFVCQLEEEVERMRQAVKTMSVEQMAQADYNFHMIIFREGGIKLFQEIFLTLSSFTMEEIKKSYLSTDLERNALDHQEIADAIRSGDREKAIIRHSAHFPVVLKNLNIPE